MSCCSRCAGFFQPGADSSADLKYSMTVAEFRSGSCPGFSAGCILCCRSRELVCAELPLDTPESTTVTATWIAVRDFRPSSTTYGKMVDIELEIRCDDDWYLKIYWRVVTNRSKYVSPLGFALVLLYADIFVRERLKPPGLAC